MDLTTRQAGLMEEVTLIWGEVMGALEDEYMRATGREIVAVGGAVNDAPVTGEDDGAAKE